MRKLPLIIGALAVFLVIIISLFGFGVISLAITPTCDASHAGIKWCNPGATNELWECKWNPNFNRYEWYSTYCYTDGINPAWCVNPECKENAECSTRPVADPKPCIINDWRCNVGTGNIDQCVSVIGYPQWVQWELCPSGCSGCECIELSCDGTDTSCGTYPNCINCNANDACVNGYYNDYYCNPWGTGCDVTATCTETCCDAYFGDVNAYCSGGSCFAPVVPPSCGNGICQAELGETCLNCPEDCGECPSIPWEYIVIGIIIVVVVIGAVYWRRRK